MFKRANENVKNAVVTRQNEIEENKKKLSSIIRELQMKVLLFKNINFWLINVLERWSFKKTIAFFKNQGRKKLISKKLKLRK